MNGFERRFGRRPEATADAPGRVNLLGEHTDYNDGFVLPVAIPQRTTVAVARADGGRFTLDAASLDESAQFDLATPPEAHFARYVYGCLKELAGRGIDVPPLDIRVESDVPIGVGLSSSAALEVATLRAVRRLLAIDLDDVEVARLAQQAEVAHAGVHCGIMDQMASSLADAEHMLFLDTRSFERRLVPLPTASEVLVLDSGMPRALAASGYNRRRAECEEAARRLGVRALRDVEDPAAVESLDEPYRRRARHVVTENSRVLEAVQAKHAAQFGRLMRASHRSLADDYEVSTAELDLLVELLGQCREVHGARLTGAGFGGACVALCRAGTGRTVGRRVLERYRKSGHRGRLLVPEPSGSAPPD
jgi:galactokinase